MRPILNGMSTAGAATGAAASDGDGPCREAGAIARAFRGLAAGPRDRATGVLGLPQRVDPTVLRLGTAIALLGALVLLILGPPGVPQPWEWIALGAGCVLVLVAATGPNEGRASFPAVIGIGALAVGVLLVRSAIT